MQPHEKRENWLGFVRFERLLNQFFAELYNSRKTKIYPILFSLCRFLPQIEVFSLSSVFSLKCIEKELPQMLFNLHLRQPISLTF